MSAVAAPADASLARPASLDEAVEAVRAAGTMLFRGGGTKLDWGPSPRTVDTVVDSGDMTRVLRYDPADGIAVVEAGISLAELADVVGVHGQQLAVDDPATGDGATVGGAVAAATDGPRRLRFGPVRGLVIGVTLVLADGTVARSGGTVIKNVAGYDLMRLATGSLGTLALIARVAVRLHPLPATAAALAVASGATAATHAALDLLASPLEPAAIAWQGDGTPRLLVAFEGHGEAVEAQCAAATARLAHAGLEGGERVPEDVWAELAAGQRAAPGETTARAVTLPSDLAATAADLDVAAEHAEVEAVLTSHAGLGLHDAVLRGATPQAHADCVRRWRERITARSGTVTVRSRPGGLADPDGLWDPSTVWGPPPSGLGPMRAIKEALDPHARCAPGRHVGGL